MYDIQLFGNLEVRTRGVRLTGRDLGGDAPRHVLALLALRGFVHKSQLSELLRDNGPSDPATVESHVDVLRRHLDPRPGTSHPVITTVDGGWALDAERVRTDVARFDELVAAAGGRTAAGALRPLTAALHLAGEPLLAGERTTWAAEARDRYRGRLVAALLDAAGHALSGGHAREALTLARRAVRNDPATERGRLLCAAAHEALTDLTERRPRLAGLAA